MLNMEILQQFGPYAVSVFILGLWLKREIGRADDAVSAYKELQSKLEELAEKSHVLGSETKQQVAALTTIITAGGRS